MKSFKSALLVTALLAFVTTSHAQQLGSTIVIETEDKIAITGDSTYQTGILGMSQYGYAINGITQKGIAGEFVSLYDGTALSATALRHDGNALEVNGAIVSRRTPRNYIVVYDPETGAEVGRFEFKFIVEP